MRRLLDALVFLPRRRETNNIARIRWFRGNKHIGPAILNFRRASGIDGSHAAITFVRRAYSFAFSRYTSICDFTAETQRGRC
jgi:hypothetical protein